MKQRLTILSLVTLTTACEPTMPEASVPTVIDIGGPSAVLPVRQVAQSEGGLCSS